MNLKQIKYEVNVNIDENVDWDVDTHFGAEVGRGDNERVGIYIGS